MSLKKYLFKIAIQGDGSTVEQAWNDACTEFSLEPGPPPEENDYTVEEEEED